MPSLIQIALCLLLLGAVNAWADSFEALPAQQKVFKNITEHRFREQLYKQKPLELVTSPLAGNQGPDRALLNILSAMKAKEYEWWSGAWDQQSKTDWLGPIAKAKTGIEDLKRQWVTELDGKDIFLWRWVETSRYVLVTYKLKDPKNGGQFSEEKGIVFILEGGLWKATQKFAAEPFLGAVLHGQKTLELNVR
ncbi:MAG: hypothetical protein ABL925_07655 [Methylococcales bacterium]